MTSIPVNFLATGTGAQPGCSTGCTAVAGESADGGFAALLGLGDSANGVLIDASALQPLLQSPAIAALPPDVVQRLAELLEGGQPISTEDLAEAVGEDTDGASLPDVIAGLLQALPQQIVLPGNADQEASAETDTAAVPIADGAPPPPPIPPLTGDDAATLPKKAPAPPEAGARPHPAAAPLPQASGDDDVAAQAPTAEQNKIAESAAKVARTAAAASDTATADSSPDAAKVTAAVQAQPGADQRKAGQGDKQVSEAPATGDEPKPAEKPKTAAPSATGQAHLERAASRASELAQQRVSAILEHRILSTTEDGHNAADGDATIDGPSLGSPQNALDAARGLRLAALTGTNGQAQLPIAQLAAQIAAQARAGANRFSIRLDPPELGKIDIRLDVSHDGSVASRLSVERPETLDMLLRDAKSLERALNDAGLKTDEGSLRFSLKGEGFGQSQQQNMQQQGRRRDADQLAAIEAMNEGAALADVRRYLATTALDIVV